MTSHLESFKAKSIKMAEDIAVLLDEKLKGDPLYREIGVTACAFIVAGTFENKAKALKQIDLVYDLLQAEMRKARGTVN